MATTMNLIAKQTVGSAGAASVTFSSIPQTFTDLKVVYSARSSSTSGTSELMAISFNGTTTNYNRLLIEGNGSTAASYSGALRSFGGMPTSNATSNTFGNGELYIPNYVSSNNKSYSGDSVSENNATSSVINLDANIWNNTAAITSIAITTYNSNNFVEFSEFTLYGISSNTTTQNQTTPSAIGGDIIRTDGTYWYHTFLYSGTFTPLKNLTCDYLVVAGGGGGNGGTSGSQVGGGGGAGGLRSTVTATGGGGTLESSLALLANTAYTATVGAGGNGGAGGSNSSTGAQGSNSVFSTITSIGGGRAPGGTGGSGGGGNYGPNSGVTTGGARTTNQGFAGGDGDLNSPFRGGGGGGAGAVGATGLASGNGGNGVATSISGTSTTYAGGGGASATLTGAARGTGGTGGGGNGGANNSVGANGGINLGAGGGGGAEVGSMAGGAGGSGIIVVRYAV
jgi:hypothetical protein